MNIIQERLDALTNGGIKLNSGSHPSFEDGHCAMEVVAWLAGLGHTDAPECASPVLQSFTISLNDQWDAEQRQKLIPFLPRMVGTANDDQDEARSYLALDWLIRTYTPAWLDLAGLTAEAQELRGLRRIVDLGAAEAAGPVVRSAQNSAAAAWDATGAAAAWDATGATARAAARVAAGVAAGAAAGAAARASARDAAWNATRDAAWDAARNAARAAAWNATRDAAWNAAWNATRDAAWNAAWNATRAAAWDALLPTVATLQASALGLLDRMIDPSAVTA